MIPRILHFVVPERVSPSQQNCIQKAKEVNPSWETRIWRESDPPRGRLSKFLGKCNSGAQRADLMRLDALVDSGGVYLDADVLLHQPLEPLIHNYDFFICSEDGYNLTNAVFGAMPGHPALHALIEELLRSEPDWSVPPNETTGPVLFGSLLKWRSDIAILPRETFYPYNWNEPPCAPLPLSLGEHLWDNSWKVAQAPHMALPPLRTIVKGFVRRLIGASYRAFRPFVRVHRIGKAALTPPGPHPSSQEAQCYTMSQEIVLRTRYGHILLLSGYDLSVTPHIVFKGVYEEEEGEERFVVKTLRGGDWFIDVGANIGSFSMLGATKVGPFGRVFAFEPNPQVADLLARAAVANWMHDRIVVQHCALGDTCGKVNLTFSESRFGDGRVQYQREQHSAFSRTLEHVGRVRSIEVEQRTLDEVIPIDLPIKLLKIDAEGHEGAILRGARRLLSARAFEFIVLEALSEVNPARWHECVAEFEGLAKLGYKCGTLTKDGGINPADSLGSALRRERSRSLVFY